MMDMKELVDKITRDVVENLKNQQGMSAGQTSSL